jgi:transglutaminase-like putative cysteine protease
MMNKKILARWFWSLCIGLLTFVTFVPPALADTNFQIALKTTYRVEEQGTTRVVHQFTIKNTQPLYAISQYGLKISSTAINQVIVNQNGKTIPAEVVTTDNQTSIGINFPEKIVGQDKTQVFTISYEDPNAAIISGKVLEVAVPRLHNFSEYTDYQVELITPASFGSPSRVTPANYTTRASQQQVTTTFNKLNGESIVALFGKEQVFEMNLRYNLENPYNGPRLTQVAFPPDTAYQKIFFHSLEPKPKTIELDDDGNWIATYLLAPNAVTTVELQAQAHVTLEPNSTILYPQPTDKLLASREFWDTHDQQVKEIAENFSSARDVYDYVVSTLSYNYNRLDTNIARLGAVTALQSPDQALCQEFTDTFITLSRATGIPSRRITGYAHTENSVLRPLSFVEDVLHAWPEYYDETQQRWIPIDPTWDHTSGGINYFDQFDLNHIVFAINGVSSDKPYPAGSYKTADQLSKDVDITFGNQVTTATLDISLQPKPLQLFNSAVTLPVTNSILVTNNTGQAFYNVQFQINPNNQLNNQVVKLASPDIITIDALLPFQQTSIPVKAQGNQPFNTSSAEIIVNYADQTQNLTINTYPQAWNFLVGPELLITVGVCLLIIAITTGCLLVFRRKK